MDVLCQAKSGMGKTAVFVLATLQQIETQTDPAVVVLCHTRELAYQIKNEYARFSKYLPSLKTAGNPASTRLITVFYGGVSLKLDLETIKNDSPQVCKTVAI